MTNYLLDTTRTIILWGASSKTEFASDNAHRRGLFDKTRQVIRYKPGTERFSLSARDTSLYFAELKRLGCYQEFERTLHSFENDEKGNPLLSGWIPLLSMKSFMALVQCDDEAKSAVMRRLTGLFAKWPKDIDILCYEGHYFTPKQVLKENSVSPESFKKFLLAKALRNEGNSPRWVAETIKVDRGQVRLWDKLEPPPGSEHLMTTVLNKFLLNNNLRNI